MSEPLLSPGVDPKDVVSGVKVIEEQANKMVGAAGKMSKAFDDFGAGLGKKARPGLDALKASMVGTVSELVNQVQHLATENDKLARELARSTLEVEKLVKARVAHTKKASADIVSVVEGEALALRKIYTEMQTDQAGFATGSSATWAGLVANQRSASAAYLVEVNRLRVAVKAEYMAMELDAAQVRLAAPARAGALRETSGGSLSQAVGAGGNKAFIDSLIAESEMIKYGYEKAFFATKEGSALVLSAMNAYYTQMDMDVRLNTTKLVESVMGSAAKMAEAEKLRLQNFMLRAAEAKTAYDMDMAALRTYFKEKEASALAHAAKMAEAEKLRLSNFMLRKAEAKTAYDMDMAAMRTYYTEQESTALASTKALGSTHVDGVAKADKFRKANSELNATMRDGHSAARGLASGFNAMWLTWGNIIPLMAGAAVSNALVKSVKAGAEFENTLRTLGELSEATAADLQMLTKEALSVGSVGRFGPQEVAEALKTLALAGLDAREQMTALKPVLNFSVVGEMNLKDAAEGLTAISTAFGYTSTGFSTVGDVVAKAAAVSMSSVTDMTQAFRLASTVAQQFGVSITDASTTLALLAQVGIRGSAAGTAMRQMYNELIGSSERAKKVIRETLDVSIIDNQTRSVKTLSVILGELSGALSKYTYEAQLNILQAMGNERGTKALSAGLTAMVTKARETGGDLKTIFQDIQEQLADAPGFVAMASIGMALTAQNQIKSVGNAMQAALIEAFQAAQPSILLVTSALRDALNSDEFKGALKSLVEGLADFVGFITRNIGVISSIATGLAVGTGAMAVFRIAVAAATVVLPPLGVAIGALAAGSLPSLAAVAAAFWPITLAAAAVGAAMWLMSDDTAKASQKAQEARQEAFDATMKGLDAEAKRLEEQMRQRRDGTTEETLAAATRMALARQDLMTMHQLSRANMQLGKDRILSARAALGTSGADVAQAAYLDKKLAELRGRVADTVIDQVRVEAEFEENVRRVKNLAVKDALEAAAAAKASRDLLTGGQKFDDAGAKAAAEAAALGLKESTNGLTSEIKLLKIEQDNADKSFANTDAINKRNSGVRGFATELESAATKVAALAKAESQYLIDVKTAERDAFRITGDAKSTPQAISQAKEDLEDAKKALGVKRDTAKAAAEIGEADAYRVRVGKIALDIANSEKAARTEEEAAYQDIVKLNEARNDLANIGRNISVEQAAQARKTAEITAADHEYTLAVQEAQIANQLEINRLLASGSTDLSYGWDQSFKKYDEAVAVALRKRNTAMATADVKAATTTKNEFQRVFDATSSVLADALMTGGSEGAKKVGDYLREELLRKPFRVIIQAVMSPITGAITDMIQGVGGAAGGGGGNLMGVASSLSNLYNMVSGGLNAGLQGGAQLAKLVGEGAIFAGNSTVAGFAGGMMSTSSMASATAAAQAGGAQAAGLIAGTFGNAMAGYTLSKMISGGYQVNSTMNKIGAIASMIPGVGPIAGVITGLINRAFGRGPTQLTSSGTRGTFSGEEFAGSNYANYKKEGGWLRSDKNWTDITAMNADVQKAWSGAFAGVKGSVASMAESLGLSTDKILSYSKYVDIAAGTTEEQLTAIFTGMADEMARTVLGTTQTVTTTTKSALGALFASLSAGASTAAAGLLGSLFKALGDKTTTTTTFAPSAFIREGETAIAALERLSSSLQAANFWMGVLSQTAFDVSLVGGDAASKLADAFGGLENMANASKAYYDLFWTDAERLEDTAVNVAKGLALVGVAMPTTKDAFRDVVSALDLTTDAGRNAYAVMLALAPEFATVADAAAASANSFFDTLTKRFDDLQKSIASERDAVAGARAGILGLTPKTAAQLAAEITEAKVALPSDAGVLAALSAKAAAQSGIDAATSAQSGTSSLYGGLLTTAQTGLTTTISYYKDLANKFQTRALDYAIRVNATGTNNDAYSYNAATNSLNAWKDTSSHSPSGRSSYHFVEDANRFKAEQYANNTVYFLNQGNEVLAAASKAVATAQAAYNTAMAAASSTTSAASAALTAADAAAKKALEDYVDAMVKYSGDAEKAVKVLSQLREETVAYYEAQKELAGLMSASAAGLRDAVKSTRFGQLSSEASLASRQRDFATNYSMALSTTGAEKAGYADKLGAALPDLSNALKDASSTREEWVKATSKLYSQSETVAAQLVSEAEGMNYEAESLGLLGSIDTALGELASNTTILKTAIEGGAESTAKNLRLIVTQLGGVPAFASGGYHSGGLRLVGENGPELEVTGPSRIFTAQQLQAGGGGQGSAALIAEIQALRAEVVGLRAEARATAGHTSKTAKLLGRAMPDGEGIAISGSIDGGSLA